MPLTAASVSSRLTRAALLSLALLVPALERPADAQLVWTAVDPTAPQPGGWGAPVVASPQPGPPTSWPAAASPPARPPQARTPAQAGPQQAVPQQALPQQAFAPSSGGLYAGVSQPAPPPSGDRWQSTSSPRQSTRLPDVTTTARVDGGLASVPRTAPVALPPPATAPSPDEVRRLREQLRIPPIVKRAKPWPSPSLSPGVPSAFVAQWGDVFLGVSGATAGKQRDGVVDGSWTAGFGLGDAAKAVALEVSGGCGSVKDFCANGSFTARLGRLLINDATARLSLAGAWQNFAQWGNEGRQDNVYYGALSYAVPLQQGKPFAQTLQFNVGVGNSQYAPAVTTDSESQIGAFASVGVELTKFLGVSAGWSGRGANAQVSITPFGGLPITVNLLGSDLFNQTPSGAVGVLSISWGTNFLTPSF